MQRVELVQRHRVDEPLDVLDCKEVPRDVDVHPAPAVARLVLHEQAGHHGVLRQRSARGLAACRQELAQRLRRVQEPCGRFGTKHERVGRDLQLIRFHRAVLAAAQALEADLRTVVTRAHGHARAREAGAQQLPRAVGVAERAGGGDREVALQSEPAGLALDVPRPRDQGKRLEVGLRCAHASRGSSIQSAL